MTKTERASELRRLRKIVQNDGLRLDARERRNFLGEIVSLLNFNNTYHINAQQFADILSREGRLDVIMGQAISELDLNLTPSPPPPLGLVPTPNLTNEQGVWWFFQQLHNKNAVVDDCFYSNRFWSGDHIRVICRSKPFH